MKKMKGDHVKEETVKDKINVEDSLKSITETQATLIQNVVGITTNMVAKADLSDMKEAVDEHKRRIAENTSKLNSKMSMNDGNAIQYMVKKHDLIMKTTNDNMDKLTSDLKVVYGGD